MDKVDSKQEQMGNVNTEVEILRKYQKEILKVRNTITEIRNPLFEVIRWDTAADRIAGLTIYQ